MRLRSVIVALVLCCWGPAARAQHELRVETGTEYDTNPTRAERITTQAIPAPGSSALAKLVVTGGWTPDLGKTLGLSLSGGLAGKRFVDADAHGEDVLVAQAGGNASWHMRQTSHLGLALGYYEAFQRGPADRRDFQSLAPSLRLDQRLGQSLVASAGGGYRWFTFKSGDNFSFSGPTAFVNLRQMLAGDLSQGEADWEWAAGAQVEWRGFVGPACTRDSCPADPGAERHADRLWIGHLEVTRTADMLLGAGAALHINRSNSYGESLVRGVFHLRGALSLPWALSLSARAEAIVTKYSDSLPLVRDPEAGTPRVSIEDESRSTLRIELARALGPNVEIGARYVFYTSAPSSGPVDYRRQTAFLYVALFEDR